MSAPFTPSIGRPENRLALEKSPYLLQHAHNPVNWYPWGQEALTKAATEDKPIFLSVGYSACHWCHVMERESFENDDVAALLNQHFVCIKVDREERPDIDEIYMTAVQMMTGQGGWPMSVFLLPDGRPFFGGTYFPPEDRYGRIGFRSVITQLADAFKNRRPELEEVATQATEDLQKAARQRPLAPADSKQPLDFEPLLAAAIADMSQRFDRENGGFGDAPKFPPHHALRLLLLSLATTDRDDLLSGEAAPLLHSTLTHMAMAGVYDHVGGGFHRYSTDAAWLLPHFEKMLYDNALLARVYADAYAKTGNRAFARIAHETCDWVLRDMTDDTGGFHSALDADSEGEEGKYYVWTHTELTEILGDVAPLFAETYHFVPEGNYREEATGHLTGANIPYLALGESALHLPESLSEIVLQAREALLQRRYERVPPAKDDKVITAWNGLMIGGLAYCGQVLSEPRYTAAAIRAANFCLTTLRDKATGKLLHRYAKGDAAIGAFLDDYAYLADGLIDLHEATGDAVYVTEARGLLSILLTDFWDEEEGGFFFVGRGEEKLVARSKDLFDGALPSANGVAARALLRLGHTLPDAAGNPYTRAARAFLENYRGMMERAPNGTHSLVEAAALLPQTTSAVLAPVSFHAEKKEAAILPGEHLILQFVLVIAPGYHINAHIPDQPHLIATVATLATDADAAIGPVHYPAPTPHLVAGDTLTGHSGTVHFAVPVTLAPDAAPGKRAVTVAIQFQVCSETACLAPDTLAASVTLRVGNRQ